MKNVRRLLVLLLVLAIAAAIFFAMQPQPIKADFAEVIRGSLQVTVDEDGKTRIKERYVVSAPIAGRLLRIQIDPGDRVEANSTKLATIEPTDPQLLNPRELASAEAREKAAEVALKRADPGVESARADLGFAEADLARKRKLKATNAVSASILQEAERSYRMKAEQFRSATFAADIARFELEQAKAALMPARKGGKSAEDWRFPIESPISGKVLRLFQESSSVVAPGAPLLEVGDPTDLELEIDVLSSDAVKIHEGQSVVIEHWGGAEALTGVVRLVEPSAFTKISALGVEEQRVNAIIDLLDPVEKRKTLGDGFRVEVRIVVWEGSDLLLVPTNAMFRDEHGWQVFVVEDGVAKKRSIKIGQRNTSYAEVQDGLTEGDTVVALPGDDIFDGVDVVQREQQ